MIYAYESEDFGKKCLETFGHEIESVYVKKDERLDEVLKLQKNSSLSHLIVSGDYEFIKQAISYAVKAQISIGIIPMPTQKELMRTFKLPSKLQDAIELASTPTQKGIDLLRCNGKIVLQEVVVADAPPLDAFESSVEKKSLFERFSIFLDTLARVKRLKHHAFNIKMSNEQEIKLSAVGIVGIMYRNGTFASKLISNEISAKDGKVSVTILSPTSLMQYAGYLFRSILAHFSQRRLPDSTGYLRSTYFGISSKDEVEYKIDSKIKGSLPVEMNVQKEVLRLSVGEKFWEQEQSSGETKDSIKIENLPKDEERIEYLSRGIPLFTHASKEQYAALFSQLREEGRLNSVFVTLIVLSTLIAAFGLFINSASVIIGAMLLAPLMQPIVSMSMGILRQDTQLIYSGAKSVGVGILIVLAASALVALLIPMQNLTSEMSGRLSPTILDLFVAIVSGIAAAYAKNNEKIVGTLAGVSIAVALVPPISVAGIGIGWGSWQIFSSSFLLFLTNLVGIVLAASLTFLVLGFSPLHIAKKGVAIWLIVATVVAAPLYSSFEKIKSDIKLKKSLSSLVLHLKEHDISITDVKLEHDASRQLLVCEVTTSSPLALQELKELKRKILSYVKREFSIVIKYRFELP